MTTRSRVDLDPLSRSQIIFEKYMHVSIMDTVLSVPLLSGHLSKSRQSFPLAKLTCSKRSSLFDSRGHLFRGPNELSPIVFISIKQVLLQGDHTSAADGLCISLSGLLFPCF